MSPNLSAGTSTAKKPTLRAPSCLSLGSTLSHRSRTSPSTSAGASSPSRWPPPSRPIRARDRPSPNAASTFPRRSSPTDSSTWPCPAWATRTRSGCSSRAAKWKGRRVLERIIPSTTRSPSKKESELLQEQPRKNVLLMCLSAPLFCSWRLENGRKKYSAYALTLRMCNCYSCIYQYVVQHSHAVH